MSVKLGEVQSDPIGLDGGLNSYIYVLSNPAIALDPYGLELLPLFGRPFVGPPRPLMGPPKPEFSGPRLGESLSDYATRLSRAREIERMQTRPEIHQNQRPTSIPESPAKGWFDLVKHIIKLAKYYNQYSFIAEFMNDDESDDCGKDINKSSQQNSDIESAWEDACVNNPLCT